VNHNLLPFFYLITLILRFAIKVKANLLSPFKIERIDCLPDGVPETIEICLGVLEQETQVSVSGRIFNLSSGIGFLQ
jgi:hypothetical protein